MASILRRSLKIRVFVVFFLMAAAAVGLLGVITFFAGRSIIQKQVENALLSTAQNKEMNLVSLMVRDRIVYQLTDADKWLTEAVEKILNNDSNSSQSVSEACAYLEAFVKGVPNLDEVFVMDLTGKIIVSSIAERVGENKANDEYFTAGIKGFHFKSVYMSKTVAKPSWAVSGPFLGLDRKKQIGVLTLRYSIAGLNAVLTERAGLGETGESYLVDKSGIMISESRFNKDVILKQKVDTEPVRLFQQSGKQMEGIYKDYRNQPVLGVSMGDDIAKEADLGWVLLSEIDAVEAFAPVNRLGMTIFILGLIISVLIGLAAFLIAQGIANPIALIAQVAQKIGEGDLTVNVADTKAEDEIGILSKSFKQTIIGLRAMVSQVLNVAERVSSSSQELSSSAQEMNATTEEVSSTVQQIAKGTETQAQKVEETQKVMEEMSASVGQVSKSAQDAAQQAAKAADIAQKGGESMKQAQDKITEVSEVVLNSANTVKKLGDRSEQIGEIVGVITNIADQTNLLALNAAIEAARAGEYGRGFAVVAEEVRKLAESSAKAADEIGKLIKEVQKETTHAVNNIEGASKGAKEVKEHGEKVGVALQDIIKNVESVATMIEQVSAASQQQAAGTKQTSKAVSEIAAVAEETASATEEASASTEEMTASMEEMAASAQELADMGMSLRDMVGKFKLGEEASRGTKDEGRETKKEESPRIVKLREQTAAMKKRMEELRKTRISTDKKTDKHG